MAHVSTKKKKKGHFSVNIDGYSAQVTYDVQFDGTDNTLKAACFAPGIPAVRSMHPDQAYLYCQRVNAEAVDQAYQNFEVTASYGIEQTTGAGGDLADPLSAPVQRTLRLAHSTEAIDTDIDDAAIVNIAGEPFDPPLQANFADLQINFVRNEAEHPIAKAMAYKWRTNADTFMGAAPDTAIIADIAATENLDADPTYWQVSYSIIFREPTDKHPKPWTIRTLHRGFRYVDADGNTVTATDTEGKPLNEPILLNANGAPLKPTQLGLTGPDEFEPHWLYFKRYESVSFNALNLA